MFLKRILGCVLLVSICSSVFAEGSYQTGLWVNQRLADFQSSGYPLMVDILTAGEVINVSLCGRADDDDVSVEILDPDGNSVYTSGTMAQGNVSCTDPFTAPLTTPIRYTTSKTGAYTVRLENLMGLNGEDKDITRFDITVTANNTIAPDPTASSGRVWATGWQFQTYYFTKDVATDADYYVLLPGGRSNTNYVWKLDLNKFSANENILLANDIGVDAPYSGYSIPIATGSVSAKYPQYLGYPAIAKPRPTQPPVLSEGFTFIDNAGQDFAISPGTTAAVQDSGNFQFTSDVAGTYAITIDTNKDGVFGAGDKLLLGNMVAGENNVPWNGSDANGATLAVGEYAVRLQARLGEYHFIAEDVETSGGSEDGLTIYQANSDGSTGLTRVYWDDATYLDGASILPDGERASHSAGKHTWGDFTNTGFGNDRYIDTYVYGLASTYTAITAIVSDDTLQTGTDGTVTAPATSVAGSYISLSVNEPDANILSGVIETITVVVNNATTGEREQLTLTETDINSGIFSAQLITINTSGTGTSNDDEMNVQIGQSLVTTYQDQLTSTGTPASVTAYTRIVDLTAPVISLVGTSPVTIEQGKAYTDLGATASDAVDGVIVLTINSIGTVSTVNTEVAGSYTVTYSFTDSDGNAATPVTRIVNVTNDATAPVISLQGSNPVNVALGGSYSDAGATATDNIDGDISAHIVTVNPVDTALVGTYTISYNVSDAAGNAAIELTRTVNVTFDPLPDDDGDGIKNGDEGTGDFDGDGVLDFLDLDSDNDGIPDAIEGSSDSDADGVPDYLDLDSDNDGLYDLVESGADYAALDTLRDGTIDVTYSVGANGLADAVETTVDSATLSYNNGSPLDSDADGVEDYVDLDSDNDALTDVYEAGGVDPDGDGIVGSGAPTVDAYGVATAGAALTPIDFDGDGVNDQIDLDSDNDGIIDVIEFAGKDADGDGQIGSAPVQVDSKGLSVDGSLPARDTDGDGVPNQHDLDSDNDGIPDVTEAGGSDPDGDGTAGSAALTVNEQGIGTILNPGDIDGDSILDPYDPDSDGDGLFDLVEGGGPDTDNNGLVDGFKDTNGDGFDDAIAAQALPLPDTDGDGIPDYKDNDDTDNDGVPDSVDIDDDNDGIPDALEGDGKVDTDGDGIPDSRDLDSDNDGLYDLDEAGLENPSGMDTDNNGRIDSGLDVGSNGLADVLETPVESGLINYNNGVLLDTDGDGVQDYRDLDSDNDSIPDVIESGGYDGDGDGKPGTVNPAVDNNGLAIVAGSDPLDTDKDGIPDQQDKDSDNDGIPDLQEAGNPDSDNNGEVDNFVDANGDGFNDDSALAPLELPDSDNNGIPDIRDSAAIAGAGPIDIGLSGIGEFNLGLLALLGTLAGLRCVKLLIGSMLSLLMLLMLQGEALAQQDEYQRHFYIGAGIGPSTLQPSTARSKYTLDSGSGMGSRLHGGLDLSESVSVELSLSNLGTATFQPSGKVDYSVNVVNVLYYLHNEGKIEHAGIAAYVKAGLGKIDISSDIPYEMNNSSQITLGAGVEYAWANGFALRADVESFDEDASLVTVGLLYRFGKQGKLSGKDSDQDGVIDSIDQCPQTPFLVTVDHRGCELDSDKDGVIDDLDYCPRTAQGISVDTQGCELDSDKDGVIDALDKCPETDTAQGVTVDIDGCTLDSDRDGVIDEQDKCPGTINGVKVTAAGCSMIKAKKAEAKARARARARAEAKAKADADADEISKLWKAIILKKHAESIDAPIKDDMGDNKGANTDADSNADTDTDATPDANASDGIQRVWEEIVLKKPRVPKSQKSGE